MSVPAANLQEMYAKYGRDVFHFALYLCGDRTVAEDLTSETFLRAFTSPSPVVAATAKAYLLTITRNLNLERLRRAGRDTELPESLEAGVRVEREVTARDELEHVLRAMATLPESERAALVLKSSHELAYEEIGALLGMTAVAARVKVHRARKKLMEIRTGGGR